MHNFGVMAQGLLNGESRFLSPCDFKELGVAKRPLSTTSARSAVRQPWSIIAREPIFLKAATNLNVVQPKLFQATRQDDLRFSDCTVSVIQILDDADAAFRILGAGLRTVLSVTTMFADKPHRLNGRTSAQRFCVLTILPPVTALAVGLPAQRAIAQRFRAMVESRCGAVALGRTYLLPPLSSGGALVVPPWLRFHIPLIEPDRQISRIRLSDKTSRLRV